MGRAGEMQQVELDDAPAGDLRPSRGRRARWVVATVAVVALLGVATVQVAADRHEDAALARLRTLPGVLEPVGEHLVARPADRKAIMDLWGWPVDVGGDG